MFAVIATCFAYFEECELFSVNLCKWSFPGAPWDQYVYTQAQHKPSDTQSGSQSRAQLKVQAQSPSPRGLSGLLIQSGAFAN